MKNFFKKICNIWYIKELRIKIITTLILLLAYRFGSYVPIPGINPLEINNLLEKFYFFRSKGLMQILSSFTGGAFNRASILALGIMPYISSSIMMQLMCIIFPRLYRIQKEGEVGKRKISFITRWLTLIVCLIQSPIYLISLTRGLIPFSSFYHSIYLININSVYGQFIFFILGIIILTSGTIFTIWLGDQITDKGIGNGVSLIIVSGIISRFPNAITKEIIFKLNLGSRGWIILFLEFFLWLLVILLSIIIIKAVRKIPVQYVSHYYKSLDSNSNNHNHYLINKKYQFIPLKIIAVGVMPLIFSQAIMLLPMTFYDYLENENIKKIFRIFQDIYGLWYNLTITILVIIFTFFYTAITIPVNQIANDLKRNGGYIPRIKPGIDTVKYIDHVLSYITLPGSILLAIIAILPSMVFKMGVTHNFSLFYGGTSLLIVVGVILDMYQQINIYLLNHHYDEIMMNNSNFNYYNKL
ncbi:preprotein translocase subunit SecY [Blattabacterium cuenoti]|uniref:preprotein translocase subunit SecY n=1 Tax=Blattabacterium cuenoti TaxID=1653831 RepID=UPI00163C5D98|nr:preprotein translocase subunit SecY [Blattabacterium cuenoti]